MKFVLHFSKFLVKVKQFNIITDKTHWLLQKLKATKTTVRDLKQHKINIPQFPFKKWSVKFDKVRHGIISNHLYSKDVSSKNLASKHEAQTTSDFWLAVKLSVAIFTTLFVSIGSYTVFKLGSPEEDEQGRPVFDEFSELPLVRQYLYRALREMEYYTKLIKKPADVKLLPDRLGFPYSQPKYTLVIELSDILIHSEWTYATGWQFRIRPGLQFLLDSLHHYYEIVVYISEPGLGELPVIEAIDPKHVIAYKLIREGSLFSGGVDIESLNHLNRDLRKVIVIDWDSKVVKLHADNLLQVKRWNGEDDDTALIDLAMFLKTVAENNIDDVREVLKHYQQFDDPIMVFRDNQKKYIDYLEGLAASARSSEQEEKKKQKQKSWLMELFRKKNT